jgi:hypothetical protein
MNDKDQKNLQSLYEDVNINLDNEGGEDHIIYIDLDDDTWEIDLNSKEHQEDHYALLDKIKNFLIFYKNDGDTNHHFLNGLLGSKKFENYLKKFDTHPKEFLNKL